MPKIKNADSIKCEDVEQLEFLHISSEQAVNKGTTTLRDSSAAYFKCS